MSNLGLERHLAGLGLTLERTAVGDRYVIERMREKGYNVGGEQSGHVIFSDYATTGDGLVSALQVLAVVQKLGKPVSEVCHRFDPLPQVLRNVRFNGGKPLENPVGRQGDRRRDGPARRPRPARHPPVGHRAGDPGDGRGGRPGAGRRAGRRRLRRGGRRRRLIRPSAAIAIGERLRRAARRARGSIARSSSDRPAEICSSLSRALESGAADEATPLMLSGDEPPCTEAGCSAPG